VRKREQLIDPWGRAFLYRYPGEQGDYDLYSLGADGVDGGDGEDADVTSW
jgi:general secretion pathway protein G